MMFFTGSFLVDLVGVFTALLVTIYAYFKWSYLYWKRRNVPYIEPTMPFGNFENPFRRTRFFGDIAVDIYKHAKAKGWKYCGLYALAAPNLMILDLQLLKRVLTKDFQHFTDRGTYINERDDPLTGHLFHLTGSKWRNLRAKLTPTFTSGKLKAMFQTLVDCGLVLEQYLVDNVSSEDPVDIKEFLGRFSTDIIGSCAFGIDCNSFKDPNSPFRVYGKKHFAKTKVQALKEAFGSNFPTLARALRITKTEKDVSDFFIKLVANTVDYREKHNIIRRDVLQLLIEMKNDKDGQENGVADKPESLTMNEIAAQCFVFFLGGFETSSTTGAFALFELANHPEMQDRVREEIKTVLAKHDNKMTYDSLSELVYMKQVIDETLRMYPPATFLTRLCIEDYKVPGEDLIIEKGVHIVVPAQALQYDEEYFKDPKVFDPERFNEKNKKNILNYTYMPFGEGPRICIGERFGVMQTKIGLTSVLRKFRVSVHKKMKVPMKISPHNFIPSAEGEIWLRLEKI